MMVAVVAFRSLNYYCHHYKHCQHYSSSHTMMLTMLMKIVWASVIEIVAVVVEDDVDVDEDLLPLKSSMIAYGH